MPNAEWLQSLLEFFCAQMPHVDVSVHEYESTDISFLSW